MDPAYICALTSNPMTGVNGDDLSAWAGGSHTWALNLFGPKPQITSIGMGAYLAFYKLGNGTETMVPLSYLWDFGDGQTSTEVNPVHTYASDNIYTITLTASNSVGTDNATDYAFCSTAVLTDDILSEGTWRVRADEYAVFVGYGGENFDDFNPPNGGLPTNRYEVMGYANTGQKEYLFVLVDISADHSGSAAWSMILERIPTK